MIEKMPGTARMPNFGARRLVALMGALLVLLLLLPQGCGSKEEAQPAKSGKVTKPIHPPTGPAQTAAPTQTTAPAQTAAPQPAAPGQLAVPAQTAATTQAAAKAQAAALAQAAAPAEEKDRGEQAQAAPKETAVAPAEEGSEEDAEMAPLVSKDSQLLRIWEAENKKFAFNPIGRADPFMPIVWEKSEREKRAAIPTGKALTPLQMVPLSSIKLIAVIAPKAGEPIAMVEDATGMGYIVKKGTPIGPNNGEVMGIFGSEDVAEKGMIKTIKPARIVVKEQFRYFNTTRTNIEEIQIKGEK